MITFSRTQAVCYEDIALVTFVTVSPKQAIIKYSYISMARENN